MTARAQPGSRGLSKKKMHLGFDVSYTHMGGRWRMPGSWSDHGKTFPDVEMYERIARIAERGLLDMIFSGDGTGVPDTWQGKRDAAIEWGINWPRQDLSPAMVAMSRVTKHVGFGATWSSTFMHPFYMARLLNSLDHVTGGRIAMNLIASTRRSDAANYGFDELMEHSSRYDRMEEFIDVCRKLWDATEQEAMIWDPVTGVVGDPAKVHSMKHVGKFFKVEGPLNTPPSPQGRPVVIQAGYSPRGVRASAYVADHVFGADMDLRLQVAQRKALDQALVEMGKGPEKTGILWQTPIVVAETDAEAQARKDLLLTAIPDEAVGVYLSYNNGWDFSTLPESFTLAEVHEQIVATQASPVGFIHELALKVGRDTTLSRKEFFELGRLFAIGYETMISGSPATIADILEEKFEATGSRGGFMFGHSVSMPRDLDDLADLLIPELQRRGRFRTEYKGKTLRENLSDD